MLWAHCDSRRHEYTARLNYGRAYLLGCTYNNNFWRVQTWTQKCMPVRWPKKDFLSKLDMLQILHWNGTSDSGIITLLWRSDFRVAIKLDCGVATAFIDVFCWRFITKVWTDVAAVSTVSWKVKKIWKLSYIQCPTPFPYFVWQKGYFHLFPLTVGISSPLISLLSCSFTLFHLINRFDICVPLVLGLKSC